MRPWGWICVAAIIGLAAGVGRAYLECGGFDAASSLVGTYFPSAPGIDLWQPPRGQQAKAAFAQTEHQFGTLEIGRKLRFQFAVRNDGAWPLVLSRRESSCICTVLELDASPLAPGDSRPVTLEWSAPDNGRPGDPYRQWVELATNDPQQSIVRLTVEGKLAASLAADVSELALGRSAESQTKTASFRVYGYNRTANAADSGPSLACEMEEMPGAEAFVIAAHELPAAELEPSGAAVGWRVDVVVKPGLPRGPFLQTIRLRTDDPKSPVVPVPVRGEIGPDFFVVGPGYSERTGALYFGKAMMGVQRRRLSLVLFGDDANSAEPRILPLLGPLTAVLGKGEMTEDGSRRWPLDIEVTARSEETPGVVLAQENKPPRQALGNISIWSGREENEQVEIAVVYEAK